MVVHRTMSSSSCPVLNNSHDHDASDTPDAMTTTTTTIDHVLEAGFDPMFWTDRQGVILKVNTVALQTFGYSSLANNNAAADDGRRQMIGQNIAMFIGGGGSQAQSHAGYFAALQRELLDAGDPQPQQQQQPPQGDGSLLQRIRQGRIMTDVMARKRDGTEFPVQVGLCIVPDGHLATVRDLSNSRQQSRLLAQAEARVRAQKLVNKSVLDAALDAILVTTKEGVIVNVNRVAAQVFGYDDDDDDDDDDNGDDADAVDGDDDDHAATSSSTSSSPMIGLNVKELVGGGHAEYHEAYMKDFLERGGSGSVLGTQRDLLARRKDGSEFPCRIGINTVRGTTDGLMVGFIRDITAEKEKQALEVEKQAAEHLLMNMLPQEIAERLKAKPEQIADQFTEACVLFGDIVGFTSMASQLEPVEVVSFLNEIFSRFDDRLDEYGLNKIKTIGDCYMVTSIPGLAHNEQQCAPVCHFAIDMIDELTKYNQKNGEKHRLDMRIGINVGPVVAGVVGTRRFLYDLWGDAVNIASRMESMGVPGKIQVTQSVVDACPPSEFDFDKRGVVDVKGIGEMETFFLTGRHVSDRKLKRYRSHRGSFACTSLERGLELLQSAEQLDETLPEPRRGGRRGDHMSTLRSLSRDFMSTDSLPEF